MQDKKNIELWDDLVNIKDLVISIAISVICTMGAYLLAPNNPTIKLFAGLGGVMLGFLISTIIIRPKRKVEVVDSTKKTNGEKTE